MDRIKSMVKDLVEMSYEAKFKEKTSCRFTVTVDWEDNRRLEYVTKKLGMSKSNFFGSVIKTLLAEFEAELSITTTPEKVAGYWSWVNSNDPVPDFSDDIGNVKVTVSDKNGTRGVDMKGGDVD